MDIFSRWQAVSRQLACEKIKKRMNSRLYLLRPYPSTMLLTTKSLDLLIWLPNSYCSNLGSCMERRWMSRYSSKDSLYTWRSLYDCFKTVVLSKNTKKFNWGEGNYTVKRCWFSVVGCRLSVVGCQLSVVGCRYSVIGVRLLTDNWQLITKKTDNRQLDVLGC